MSDAVQPPAKQRPALVVGAASAGTIFEWYDFYLYGSLAVVLRPQFFAGVNEATGFIFVLLAFAAGFIVRPFGALVFGPLGDKWGRKNTFLVTMILMGLSTFGVGLIPNYDTIGIVAPLLLITLRLVQGLALGGEYGGAATYVAEHAPPGKRGLFTSFIQTTATLGLFLSLLVILTVRTTMGEEAFAAWGWRIPFLISAVLLAVSVWIRLQLNESPVFQDMVKEGKQSKQPLADSFLNLGNLKIVLLALLGLTAGQAVVWYTGQFYALFFLEQVLKVPGALTNVLVACALALATPFFVVFGWLSDKYGRKWIIMTGCALAAVTYFPLFGMLTQAANPALAAAQERAPVVVIADQTECSVQFDPVGGAKFLSSCDIAKSSLARAGVPYTNEGAYEGQVANISIGGAAVVSFHGEELSDADFATEKARFDAELRASLDEAGYPAQADPDQVNKPMVVAILFVLVLYVTMVYGPIAAMLVELFPTRIRYTSMSLPYHIGNGWFGGLLPTFSFALIVLTGNIYFGLIYPVAIAALTLIIGAINLKETKDVDISA